MAMQDRGRTPTAGTQDYNPEGAAQEVKGKADEAMETAKQRTGEAVDRVREQAGAAAGTAKEKAHEGLHNAADAVRERAQDLPGGERTTQAAYRAAEKLDVAANYVRDHDMQEMMGDMEGFVRQYPTQSLVAAAIAGFLLGRAVRR